MVTLLGLIHRQLFPELRRGSEGPGQGAKASQSSRGSRRGTEGPLQTPGPSQATVRTGVGRKVQTHVP